MWCRDWNIVFTMIGDAKSFSYRAVTAETNDDGDKIKVKYGSNVCKLGFQVYKILDTAREHPLLDPEYILEVPQSGSIPNFIEVEIPGFEKLGPDEFSVVVTAYDCLNDEAIDSDEVTMSGVIAPPLTGSMNILGLTVSRADYLITGLLAFVGVTVFALFLLGRRKKTSR